MYFLLNTCENPDVLRVLYFGLIIKDIVFTIIPVALVVMIIIDFSKAIVSGDTSAQAKIVNYIPKRIMYAVIIFALPWGIHIFMKTLDTLKLSVGEDYITCIHNVRNYKGNFEHFDKLLQEEEDAENIVANNAGGSSSTHTTDGSTFGGHGSSFGNSDGTGNKAEIENIRQDDQRWSGVNLIGRNQYGQRTIGNAGCGFCSLTMVLRYLIDPTLTPKDVYALVRSLGGGGYGTAHPDDFVRVANYYKLHSQKHGAITSRSAADELMPLLKSGRKFIINMPGHYISVLGIRDDGTIIVGDSYRGFEKTRYKKLSELYDATMENARKHNESRLYWFNATSIWK